MVTPTKKKISILTMNQKNLHSILEVTNLEIGYFLKNRKNTVAKNLNFNLPKSSLISLVGINGVGKSTLLLTLAGMQPKINGTIRFNQIPLEQLSPLQLARQLSLVLTEKPASDNLSVYEIVALGRHPYTNWIGKLSKRDKELIATALQLTETTNFQNKKSHELSDGQLQRVLIARALAQDTPLIFLDEPTTHLDLHHRATVLKLLKKVTLENNKTILFSSHQIDLALQISDFMLIMTPETHYFNTTENLIKTGVFNTLFPKNSIEFDAGTRTFSIKY